MTRLPSAIPRGPEPVPRGAPRRPSLWTLAVAAVSAAGAVLLTVGLTAFFIFYSRAHPQEAKLLDASSEAGTIGGLRVTVRSVEISEVPGSGLFQRTSGVRYLKIALLLENLSQKQRVDYRGWGWVRIIPSDDGYLAGLADNFGNRHHTQDVQANGQVTSTSIYPGKSVNDLLVYEVPVEKAEYLVLSLPGKNVGCAGEVRFQIPQRMFAP